MLRNFLKTSILSLACLALTAPAALAQQAPSTAPASQPAAAADPTTPKGTLTLLSRATQSGDPTSVRELFHATSPQEQKMVEIMLGRASALAKFRTALVTKFGEEAATQLTGSSPAEEQAAEARINQATVKLDGDKASLTMKSEIPGEPESEPVQLVKVDGKWKLPIGAMVEGMPAAEVDASLKKWQMLSDVVNQTTEEVSSGKFKTADEVNDAVKGKLASAMLAEAAAAAGNAPASGPSTGPALP